MLNIENQIELDEALKNRNIDAVKQLLAAGTDPNWYDPNKLDEPPLNQAAYHDFIAGLEVLHAAGAQINGSELASYTPLSTACHFGKAAAARWLLHHGADVMAGGLARISPLYCALSNRKLSIADMLLEEHPELLGEPLTKISTQLIKTSPYADVFSWILNHGISPNLTVSNGNSWLIEIQCTAEDRCATLSELLLTSGADVNFQGRNGKTALHRITHLQSLPGFVRLLRAGANPDIPDAQGVSVRRLLAKDTDLRHLHEALAAWEASQQAHQVLQSQQPCPSSIKPL